MGRIRSDTHSSMMESARRPSIWAGSLRRDHIRLGDLPDEDGAERSQMYTSSKSGPSSASRQNSFAWPFHGRNASEAISTTRSSHFTLRTWQPRTFFRPHDDTASIDRSIVPDYVVNFIRGETPETLAMKKERRKWGQHGVEITPHRETFASFPIEYGHYYSHSADVTRDLNTFSSWSRKSGLRRHITGWRGGVIFNSLISFIILLVGIICLILVIAEAKLLSGESAIYSGDCTTAEHINYGIHIVISVCGVAILSGANYVFQILSSPTRREVTVAHENKQWLDIGVPSIRNFMHISSFRAVVAVIVLLSAVASQVIYNAVIFTTQNIVNYDVLFVTQSFLDHAPFNNDTRINEGRLSDLDITSLQDSASEMINMTSTTCLQQFSGVFQPSFNAVLLITDSTSTSSSLIRTAESGTQLTTFASNNDITAPDGSKVQYCLARTSTPQTCSVNLSGSILGIAVLLNLATLISMAVILARSSFAPLVTLGDAIRSFLRHPDPTTANAALLSKKDVRQGHWAFSEAQYFFPATHYWFQTPSLPRWILTILSWSAIGAPTAVALGLMISGNLDNPLTLFGVATHQFSFLPPSVFGTAQMALLSALPQFLLCILYLVINAHLTTYFLSHEFSLFALSQRSLRVSAQPSGEQTTSLYLTLPRPVSWALLAWFAAMSFSLSQAVFPGTVKFLTPSSTSSIPPPPNTADMVAVSFSTQALLSLLALLTALALTILLLGCRRTQAASLASGEVTGNPLALRGGSCSAVVSAKCHHHDIVPPGQLPEEMAVPTGEPWLRSIAWGVVEEGTGGRPGRCGFSADGVGCVDAGKTYV
ncbi:uncharacterized protein GGS22DRAFT_162028 [Annulohypoxylon maeteangense]|uniref:uncharacterized protein n=1 Tax=Annulohypoxylon maeteangense TaxID=1927788 RepID=UPI00200887E4|nr:uncharacterized protein GGS22DRAFT_162028 [Annulohypoxylon maeteangense]KAI0885792.1 hypothetical protein GGS22DRAFT_162028 [Annulohypoxylon maeteangense]